jgi:hypothetical protein
LFVSALRTGSAVPDTGAPQFAQNLFPSGTSAPQFVQNAILQPPLFFLILHPGYDKVNHLCNESVPFIFAKRHRKSREQKLTTECERPRKKTPKHRKAA